MSDVIRRPKKPFIHKAIVSIAFLNIVLILMAIPSRPSDQPDASPGQDLVKENVYPLLIKNYDVSLEFESMPEEVIEYFAGNTWRFTGPIGYDRSRIAADRSPIQSGDLKDYEGKVMGMDTPLRRITLRYIPGKAFLQTFHYHDSEITVLARTMRSGDKTKARIGFYLYFSPMVEQMIKDRKIEDPAEKIIDDIDKFLRTASTELKARQPHNGRIGDLGDIIIQVYEASVSFDNSAGKVVNWLFKKPDLLSGILPIVTVDPGCFKNPTTLVSMPTSMMKCDAFYDMEGKKEKTSIFYLGEWKKGKTFYSLDSWITLVELTIRYRVRVVQTEKGCTLTAMYASPAPSPETNPKALPITMRMSKIPDEMKQSLLKLRQAY